MSTIKQVLASRFVVSFDIDSILTQRAIDPNAEFDINIANSSQYKGALADCYMVVYTMPNITEGGMSISYSDKSMFLKLANAIYKEIGEQDKIVNSCYTKYVDFFK